MNFRMCLAGLFAVMALSQCTGEVPTSDREFDYTAFEDMPDTSDGGALINDFRARNDRGQLRPNALLEQAAAGHARDMAANDFMGHRGSDGSGVRARGRAQGYRACWFGENVARGQTSARQVVAAWIDSPAHRRNLLNRRAAEYGLARGPGNTWVLVLAEPGCR